MTEKFECFDEDASEMYAYRLTGMGVPNPDVPYEAYLAMDLLENLLPTKSESHTQTNDSALAKVIHFPVRMDLNA